ncbi:MAG: ATP-binding protein [Thermoplasmatales archaeon]|nr:ATP-binding protein [Thermoplasmatales archaeon]
MTNGRLLVFRDQDSRGRLIFLEPDEKTRFVFTLWFDYTRVLINRLREGDLVAVQNFSTSNSEIHWSILQITSTLPTHYALGPTKNDVSGYPGYIMEAAGNLPTDWLEQENSSSEDTTKIICNAIPINFEFVQGKNDSDGFPLIVEENSIPMVGSEVRILSMEMNERIFNHNIDRRDWNITVGNLIREEDINIMMRPYDAISTHIGIFGFTGVGKSNFVSSLIDSLLLTNQILKILIFDLNNEYISLLSDILSNPNLDASVLCIGDNTLPQAVVDFMKNSPGSSIEHATESYLHDMYFPRALRPLRDDFGDYVAGLLQNSRITLLEEQFDRVEEYFEMLKENELYDNATYSNHRIYIDQLVDFIVQAHGEEELTSTVAETILREFDRFVQRTDGTEDMPITSQNNEPVAKKIRMIRLKLRQIATNTTHEVASQYRKTYQDIVAALNDSRRSSIIVINSFSPDEMRNKSNYLLNSLYATRRRRGVISPLVLTVFDEADEFIPQDIRGISSYSMSKRIIETIARRGRKFGIGLGIATQRATYLDTNIMGQLHTYFISKLPRSSDRDRVSEAFSLSEEMFSQTFKFRKGDWLFISHEAAGLESVPIPIHSRNAEVRISEWLNREKHEEEKL